VNVNTVQINQITSALFISFSLDSKMECLHLTMTEVLKRQNSKSKKGYNQVSRKEVWEKTKLWFKQPQTNLVQSKHLQLLSHVVSAAMCSSRQTTFFFLPRANILVLIYLFLYRFTRHGCCFYIFGFLVSVVLSFLQSSGYSLVQLHHTLTVLRLVWLSIE